METRPSRCGDEAVTEAPSTAAAVQPSATEPGVGGRLRGALRWLVSSLGTAEQGGTPTPEATAADTSAVPAQETEATSAPAITAEEAKDADDGADPDEEPMSDEVFEERLLDLAQDILNRPAARAVRETAPLDRGMVLRYTQRLLATSLFGDLSEEELLAVVRGLRLHLHGPGDVLVTEGERGQSVFVLVSGAAKGFVRSPSGRNFPVAELREGEFFARSPPSPDGRSATITASSPCELMELDRPTMDEIARTHPRVAHVLEESYIRRASSPEAAAIRAVPMNEGGGRAQGHRGGWRPTSDRAAGTRACGCAWPSPPQGRQVRGRLPVLIGWRTTWRGRATPRRPSPSEEIEKIRRRDVEVVNLAPLGGGAGTAALPAAPRSRPARDAVPAPPPAATSPVTATPNWRQPTAEYFEGWLVDVLRDRVKRTEPAEGAAGEPSRLGSVRGYGPGLSASPLFADFNDDELLAVIRGLRLLSFDTGDIIITEGEPGQSLFVLATGTVKVFVKDPQGINVALVPLGEGAFFGEIATLSGRPRSATVTAASRCELLELDKPALESIVKVHPRVRDVLEEHYIARAADPDAAAIRGTRVDDSSRGAG